MISWCPPWSKQRPGLTKTLAVASLLLPSPLSPVFSQFHPAAGGRDSGGHSHAHSTVKKQSPYQGTNPRLGPLTSSLVLTLPRAPLLFFHPTQMIPPYPTQMTLGAFCSLAPKSLHRSLLSWHLKRAFPYPLIENQSFCFLSSHFNYLGTTHLGTYDVLV